MSLDHSTPVLGRDRRWQFRLRTLLLLTAALAGLMGLARVWPNLAWTLSTFLLVAGLVWLAHRPWLPPRVAMAMALPMFGLSLILPALSYGNGALVGWVAFLMSFVCFGLIIEWWQGAGDSLALWTFTLGCAANILLAVSYLAFLISRWWRVGLVVSGRVAVVGALLAVLDLIPLALFSVTNASRLTSIHCGYGVWLASMLVLASGSQRARSAHRQADDAAAQAAPENKPAAV